MLICSFNFEFFHINFHLKDASRFSLINRTNRLIAHEFGQFRFDSILASLETTGNILQRLSGILSSYTIRYQSMSVESHLFLSASVTLRHFHHISLSLSPVVGID